VQIKNRIQLVDLLKELNLPLIACEVGVAQGLFSEDLLNQGLERLYSIDNWGKIHGVTGDGAFHEIWHLKNHAAAQERLSKFGSKSVILKGMSAYMANYINKESIGLIYIDANHSFEGVKEDIQAFYPKLVVGGVMAFHDYENDIDYGVKSAVREFCEPRNIEIHLIPENSKQDAGAFFIKP